MRPTENFLAFIMTLQLITILMLLCVSAVHAAPIEVLGRCYATDDQAIESWENRLPVTDYSTGSNIAYGIGVWTPSASGASLSVPYTTQLDGAGVIKNHVAVFPSCDVGVSGEQPRTTVTQDLIIVSIAIFCFLFGFSFGRSLFAKMNRAGTT